VPVTLKTRLGWDDALLNAPDLARRAEAAGVAHDHHPRAHALPVLQGRADWAAIRAVKRR
jgi:tRNA-dihydrouridine synthase B